MGEVAESQTAAHSVVKYLDVLLDSGLHLEAGPEATVVAQLPLQRAPETYRLPATRSGCATDPVPRPALYAIRITGFIIRARTDITVCNGSKWIYLAAPHYPVIVVGASQSPMDDGTPPKERSHDFTSRDAAIPPRQPRLRRSDVTLAQPRCRSARPLRGFPVLCTARLQAHLRV